MNLSRSLVHEFLSQKLGILHWESKLASNKLNFLKELVAAHEVQIYYQNVSWSAISPAQRKIPTIEEVIYYGSQSSGSTCIHLNYFIKLILEYLNYDVMIVGAESPGWAVGKCHMVTVVQFPLTHEIYLIDLGFCRPILEPIPLHKMPFIGKVGGFDFHYRFNEATQNFERFAPIGCSIRGKFDADVPGKVYYVFKLEPLEFDDFHDCLVNMFTPSESSPGLLDALLLFRIVRRKSMEDFEYVCFRNKILIQGTAEKYKETVHDTYVEMLPQIRKYFPNLDWPEVTAAFLNYDEARRLKLESRE